MLHKHGPWMTLALEPATGFGSCFPGPRCWFLEPHCPGSGGCKAHVEARIRVRCMSDMQCFFGMPAHGLHALWGQSTLWHPIEACLTGLAVDQHPCWLSNLRTCAQH